MTKYKKGSAWKRAKWNKWSFGRKCLHVAAVIAALITVTIMFFGTAYVVLVIFGVYGMLMEIRDAILLAFAHWLFD